MMNYQCEIIFKGTEKHDENVQIESEKLNIFYSPIFTSSPLISKIIGAV